jgi:hypothetical protein
MTNTESVISAFLDDEPFDAQELGQALSEPEGRALLIDMVALRHLVQPDESVAAAAAPRRTWRGSLRPLVAAAAVLVALAGGYFIGERQTVPDNAANPPAPTRVVQATEWQILPAGGGR